MKPGRKSTYDLLAPMIPAQSPPPPEELEPDQQLEWEAITARLPADWFTRREYSHAPRALPAYHLRARAR